MTSTNSGNIISSIFPGITIIFPFKLLAQTKVWKYTNTQSLFYTLHTVQETFVLHNINKVYFQFKCRKDRSNGTNVIHNQLMITHFSIDGNVIIV